MLPILALRHIECEGPALIAEIARDRGIEVRIAEMPQEFPRWPEPSQYGGIVVLGGPMSVYDTQRHPWLKEEARLLRRCMDEGIPILGICLGAQLLAAAGGARVYPGEEKEIGWGEIRLIPSARSDPLLEGLPNRFEVFHWHGDTFDLPPNAALLARSALFPHQAFRIGDRWYGLQFHLEVTEGMPRQWANEYQAELAALGGPTVGGDLERSDARIRKLRPLAETVFHRWLDLAESTGG
jgi:GMP synthase-like glutamine amidotransferase